MKKFFLVPVKKLQKMGDPLSWSLVDKSILLIAALSVPSALGIALITTWAILCPDKLIFYNQNTIREICLGFWCIAAIFIGIILAGFFIRKRYPENRWFLHLTLQASWICASLIVYVSGALTSPAAASALIGIWLIVYTLFDRLPVILGLSSFLGLQFLSIWASQNGWIPYAPLMIQSIFSNGRLITSWVVIMGGGCLLFIMAVLIGSGYIIDRLRKREVKLEKLAKTDELTGLYNRRYFYELFEKEIYRSRRYNRSLALIIFDIDFFKKINDQYGHLTGDDVLVSLARLIQSQLRSPDIIARYGGEEFVILLPETDLDGACIVAERCRAAVESQKIRTKNDGEIALTISLGATNCHDAASFEIDRIIKKADDALYQAKREGRNRVASV